MNEYTPNKLDALIGEVRAHFEVQEDALALDLRHMLEDTLAYWCSDKGLTGKEVATAWEHVATIAESKASQLQALQSQFDKLVS